jgi:hypothetical protein
MIDEAQNWDCSRVSIIWAEILGVDRRKFVGFVCGFDEDTVKRCCSNG